jgi:nicotinamidase-related amidase
VIDMQDEFVRPHWTPFWVPDATRLVPGIRRLVDACRRLEVPVIYTAFARTHGYTDRPRSGASMPNRYREVAANPQWFRDGTIWRELAPAENEIVVHKPSYGAFYDTPLQTILTYLSRDTIVICGTLTNFCCGTTARQGYERASTSSWSTISHATDDRELHEAELKTLRKGFARVLSLEELLAELPHR